MVYACVSAVGRAVRDVDRLRFAVGSFNRTHARHTVGMMTACDAP